MPVPGAVRTSGDGAGDARGMQMRHDPGMRAEGADMRKEGTSVSFPLLPWGNLPPGRAASLGRLC